MFRNLFCDNLKKSIIKFTMNLNKRFDEILIVANLILQMIIIWKRNYSNKYYLIIRMWQIGFS